MKFIPKQITNEEDHSLPYYARENTEEIEIKDNQPTKSVKRTIKKQELIEFNQKIVEHANGTRELHQHRIIRNG